MQEIVKKDLEIKRSEIGKEDAYRFFEKAREPFKKEILDSRALRQDQYLHA